MHVGTNTGVLSSRRVAMAALPQTPYAVFWFSIASLLDLPGDIRRDLSMRCTCLPGWLR
ncbi:hypothetical protein M405DRAFT_817138 [Rhizopogon salebrosus TDB-379]|nr:hypothetical protein M405DRAFT_817138 [Rhizopogon salebrosus TDB-379]